MGNSWINLARFGNPTDCAFVQSILELHEIDFFVQNQHTYNLDPLSTELSDLIIILVLQEKYQEAKKILSSHEYGKYLIEQ